MSAYLELMFADLKDLPHDRYDCVTCEKFHANKARGGEYINFTAKRRKCDNDTWQNEEGKVFPLYIGKFNTPYFFCPGKINKQKIDREYVNELISRLLVSYRTGAMPDGGSYLEQEHSFANLLPWFIQKYDTLLMQTHLKGIAQIMEQVLKAFAGSKKGK